MLTAEKLTTELSYYATFSCEISVSTSSCEISVSVLRPRIVASAHRSQQPEIFRKRVSAEYPGRGNPTLDHSLITPTPHVGGPARHTALRALDQVGRRQAFVQGGGSLSRCRMNLFAIPFPRTPEPIPGTDCAALGYETKGPRPAPGAFAHTTGYSLPADLDAGSTGERAAHAGAFTVGDHLDPERILVLVVRGVDGLTQRIQAVLRRTRGCRGESRQLKDHPRAAIQFRQGEGHGRPFGSHLDLGTGSACWCALSCTPCHCG